MCGIVAIYALGRGKGPVDPDALQRATSVLHHRGPDGQRLWIAPDGRVGLGHARLSIIDLATGDQPISNEDDRVHIVVNGELYDFERVQRELRQRGHVLRTLSDSEIALHLYEELGAQCVHQLRGEFALAIWDARNQMMLAVRDRFGIKPLFYAVHDGTLYLASEMKALFAAGVPARWSPQTMQIGFGDAHPAETIFDGVGQVPPGHYLIASPRGIHVHQYWDFNYPAGTSELDTASDAECAELLRAALTDAVRTRLRADVPVGCYLSGGLDSCAVLGLAQPLCDQPIRAFTLAFDHAAYDESAIAREMAAHAGSEFCPIPMRSADLADHFFDSIWHSETICSNAHGVAKYLLSRAVNAAGYKVVLTGEGSDEILGGYPHFRRDLVLFEKEGLAPGEREQLLAELEQANAVSRGLLMPFGESVSLDAVRRALGFVPSWMEAFATGMHKLRALLAPEYAVVAEQRDPYADLLNGLNVADQLTGRPPVHQSLYMWAQTILPRYILTLLGDRMEMAHSVEGRVPFLDHHVVELVCRLPVRQKIRGMTEKFVLREAARPVLTSTVYARQKHPFLSPPAALKQEDRLLALTQDTLRGSALRSVPFFDQRKVIGMLDSLPTMSDEARTAADRSLMIMLSTCALQEVFQPSA
jgi:asparagine synthase (glutamine-hydrolysing)